MTNIKEILERIHTLSTPKEIYSEDDYTLRDTETLKTLNSILTLAMSGISQMEVASYMLGKDITEEEAASAVADRKSATAFLCKLSDLSCTPITDSVNIMGAHIEFAADKNEDAQKKAFMDLSEQKVVVMPVDLFRYITALKVRDGEMTVQEEII